MKKSTLLFLSLAGSAAVAGGSIWITVQTDEAALNDYLCQFMGNFLEGRYADPITPDCLATAVLLDLSGWLLWLCFSLLFVAAFLEGYSRLCEFKKLFSTSYVGVFLQLIEYKRRIAIACWKAWPRLSKYEKQKERQAILSSAGDSRTEKPFLETDEPHPDIRLKNIFFHIEPNCFVGTGTNVLKIGSAIIDRLSSGEITAWGREIDKGKKHPTREIPPAYWENATFDYSFFCDDGGIQAEPLPGCSGPSYGDVQFNRAQIKAAWPKAPRMGARDHMQIIWRRTMGRWLGVSW